MIADVIRLNLKIRIYIVILFVSNGTFHKIYKMTVVIIDVKQQNVLERHSLIPCQISASVHIRLVISNCCT